MFQALVWRPGAGADGLSGGAEVVIRRLRYCPIRTVAAKKKGVAKKVPATRTVTVARVCSRWIFCRIVMTCSSPLNTVDIGRFGGSGSDGGHTRHHFRGQPTFLTALASLSAAPCKAVRWISSIDFIFASASPAASRISANKK